MPKVAPKLRAAKFSARMFGVFTLKWNHIVVWHVFKRLRLKGVG